MEAIKWISANIETVIAIVTAVVTLASLVASVTPTPKDNAIIAKLYKVIDLLALNIGHAKEK